MYPGSIPGDASRTGLGQTGSGMNYLQAREKMVDNQVRPCDVTSHALIEAMLSVPREEFFPESDRALAYLDRDYPLSSLVEGRDDRFMLNPAMLAKMIQLCDVREDDVVLLIGAGSGYSAGLFSLLASSVVAVEEDGELAAYASSHLESLGYDNVAVLDGKFADGCKREAPYNVVFIEGSVDEVPQAWIDQLAEGGRLVVCKGTGNSALVHEYKKRGDVVGNVSHFNCSAPVLPGFNSEPEFAL